jgi:hypothetical protein
MKNIIANTNDTLNLCRWGLLSRNQRVHDAAESVYSFITYRLLKFEIEIPAALNSHYATIVDYNERKHLGVFEIDMVDEEDEGYDSENGTDDA